MLSRIRADISSLVVTYHSLNPWTNVYGLARSMMALSLLITLVFTGTDNLFPKVDGILMKQASMKIETISIFWLLQNNLNLACLISIAILIWVVIGYIPQVSGVLHWWVSFSYVSSGILIEGGDQIAAILTLFLIPVCLTDNRINHWSKPVENSRGYLKFFIWSIYSIISLQISVIYLNAGVAKLFVKEWFNGTAAFYWLTHSTFGVNQALEPYIYFFLKSVVFTVLITWGAIILEIVLFGWIFMKRNYWNWKILFSIAVLFHLSIAIAHGLVSFFFSMLGALTLYFFPKKLNLRMRYVYFFANT